MDAARLRQRSASHSSLRSQYRYQTRMINYTNPRPPAHRHPLRRVNENPALLRSPGPLESMLKTTTETGDIGIFSIRPNSSSAPFDRPHRPRSHPRDVDLLLPARSSGYDENYYYRSDDHKRMRPYRDTTSEIISLYGSESQHTLLSSVSPVSLEDDPRSYSMTTTSSKRIPSQKSTGTLQSQSSGGGFQRPRSPFPYPTRLKRPGVRPASPALRENGDIDYSRMVELERFSQVGLQLEAHTGISSCLTSSQRTIHGSYKPTFFHGSRRPPPLSLRAEANRSTTSLPSRPLHSPHFYVPGSYHARPPNPSMAWMPRQPSRNQPYPTDQSNRSASLTSIVEMYDKPTTSNQSCVPPQSTGSIYYDYSEQFEDRPPWDIDVDVPLHPIPQRAENIRQSLLLMDDIQGRFDIGENDSDSSESNMQEVEKDLMEPSHLSDTRERHSEGTEAKQLTLLDEPGTTDNECSALLNSIEIALNSISDKEQSQPPAGSIEASPITEADTADMGSMMNDPASKRSISPLERSPKTLKTSFSFEEDLRSRSSSQNGRLSKLRYSLDPALSDFASVLSSFDRIGRLSISKDNEVQSSDMRNIESTLYQQCETEAAASKRLSERSPPPSSNKAGTEERAYPKRHRRHIATMMISTAGVASDEFSKSSPGREDKLPILAPEPISPVHELRVKESIPQLMKSLPPLPREAQKLSGYGTVGLLPLPSCLVDEPLTPSKDEPACMNQRFSFIPLWGSSQNMQSKFSTKAVAPSPSHRIIGDVTCSVAASRPLYNVLHDYGHSPAGQSKPKLKASYSQLDPVQHSQGGPSPYSNRLKQCNSLAELAPCDVKDPVDERINTAVGGRTQVSNCESNSGSSAKAEERSTRFQPSPQPSDQFNIPYPPSPIQTTTYSSPNTAKFGTALTKAHSYDIGSSEPRGLRGKLSTLRLRYVSPQRSTTASKENRSMPSLGKTGLSTFPTVASKGTDITFGEMGSNKYLPPLPEMDKQEWRIKRWARDARKAVRLYVKKTLDRSLKANA
ncbi:hypothetical protein TGAM01_v210180 [Trichoderma gamsii]|uniref:Uncharacterized protein n=1 Tax=Trichoderma gamsii TaxID=398673 RepID=A0A2P4Z9M0_9HYPO|nr:hypothetical protein TGAM01_v210180 [Trichoderma gamsii]PON21000.1 hypothetical protein TGAM01_v210180 [Trichoderma gamsii]